MCVSYHEIVQYHMEHHQTSGILSACSRHGDKVPNLWVQALSYFAAQAEPYEEQIQIVLRGLCALSQRGEIDGVQRPLLRRSRVFAHFFFFSSSFISLIFFQPSKIASCFLH